MKYISPVPGHPADSLTGRVYRLVKQEFGVIADPFRLHAPIPQLLAAVWSVAREIRIARQVPWPIKEAVAAGVSQSNACPYCVEIHAAVASVRIKQQLATLLMQGRTIDIDDTDLRAILDWALATLIPGSSLLLAPPFSAVEAPEIIGSSVLYHYINRMATVFLPASLLPLQLREGWPGRIAWRLVARKLAQGRDREREAGSSLQFLPAADLPREFSWAIPSPVISRALAGWAEAVDRSAEELLPPHVRMLVNSFLRTWEGEAMPLSRAWVNQVVAGLADPDRDTARLALLTAVAPHQVDGDIVDAFRVHHPSDAQLIGVTAWASFRAALRIASWLHAPVEAQQHSAVRGASSIDMFGNQT